MTRNIRYLGGPAAGEVVEGLTQELEAPAEGLAAAAESATAASPPRRREAPDGGRPRQPAGGGAAPAYRRMPLEEARAKLGPIVTKAVEDKKKQGAQNLAAERQSARSHRVPKCNDAVPPVLGELKPFKGSVIVNYAGYGRYIDQGNDMKIPKRLSAEGRAKKAQKGKATCSTWKWEHCGTLNKKMMASGVVPDVDTVNQAAGLGPERSFPQHDSCAVVGNGGGLLLAEYGPIIDAHDVVIRFNGGPTKGFERHVGAKTSYRITNSQHFGFHDDPHEVLLQHVTVKSTMGMVHKWASQHGEKLHVIASEFHQYVFNVHGHGAPSNGFYGTLLANHLCKTATLFGFQKGWKGTKVKYHYYDDVEPNTSQYSRDNTEATRFAELIDGANLVANADGEWMAWAAREGWRYAKINYAEQVTGKVPSHG